MKLKHLLTTLLATAAFAFPALAEEDTPLSKEMDKINKALKLVTRNVADAGQKDANLAKIAEIKAGMEKAAGMEPAKAKDVPAGEKAKFIADYKASMAESVKTIDALKAAIEAGNTEDAAKALEKLKSQKGDGHKAFKKED